MSRKMRARHRRKLFGCIVAVVIVIAAAMGIICLKITGAAVTRTPQSSLLLDSNLPTDWASALRDYEYWNDVLKYTDGYETAWIDVDPEVWETPDGWSVGETTAGEVLGMYGVGLSSAMRDELASSEFPEMIREWYYAEDMQAGDYSDRWFLIALYDGHGTVFLYRGHHLYGMEALRIYGDEL